MSSLFSGTWTIDASRSLVWDEAQQKHVPDKVGSELITIEDDGEVQDYEVLYGENPTIRMGYTARYDDPQYVPNAVREVIGDDSPESIDAFKKRINVDTSGARARNFTVGSNYGLVRLHRVDERTHYRGMVNDAGEPLAMMLRRMAPDGDSYLASVLDPEGVLYRVRWFVRA